MTLFQYLLETFSVNEPILTSEIQFQDYSRPWLYKELNKLCEEGKLIRYERGIYYIPTQTMFGPSLLDPNKVIIKKYIRSGSDVYGYYSGVTFLSQLKLTTQMPNTIEIYTNNEQSNARGIFVGSQEVLVRRARTPITKENAAVLSFLELMNSVPAQFIMDDRRSIIERFITENGITRKAISEYVPLFPDKAIRTLVESEVIYSVAQ
mgnify:CR=1 FL=1